MRRYSRVNRQGTRSADVSRARRIHHDDKLTLRIARMNFASGKSRDRRFNSIKTLGTRLHQNARDLASRRAHDAIGLSPTTGKQGSAIDRRAGSWHVSILAAAFRRAGRPRYRLIHPDGEAEGSDRRDRRRGNEDCGKAQRTQYIAVSVRGN